MGLSLKVGNLFENSKENFYDELSDVVYTIENVTKGTNNSTNTKMCNNFQVRIYGDQLIWSMNEITN